MAEMLFFRTISGRCDQTCGSLPRVHDDLHRVERQVHLQNLPLEAAEDDQVLVGEKSSLIYTKFRWPSCVSQHTRR